MDRPPLEQLLGSDQVWCNACGDECDLTNVRVKSKTKGTWQCKSCDAKYVMLRRMGVQVPDSDEGHSIYSATKGFNSHETKKFVQEKFGNTWNRQEKVHEFGGAFLPLDVWETKGYPI